MPRAAMTTRRSGLSWSIISPRCDIDDAVFGSRVLLQDNDDARIVQALNKPTCVKPPSVIYGSKESKSTPQPSEMRAGARPGTDSATGLPQLKYIFHTSSGWLLGESRTAPPRK